MKWDLRPRFRLEKTSPGDVVSFSHHMPLPFSAQNCSGQRPTLGFGLGAWPLCGLLAHFGPMVSLITIAAFPGPVAAATCD